MCPKNDPRFLSCLCEYNVGPNELLKFAENFKADLAQSFSCKLPFKRSLIPEEVLRTPSLGNTTFENDNSLSVSQYCLELASIFAQNDKDLYSSFDRNVTAASRTSTSMGNRCTSTATLATHCHSMTNDTCTKAEWLRKGATHIRMNQSSPHAQVGCCPQARPTTFRHSHHAMLHMLGSTHQATILQRLLHLAQHQWRVFMGKLHQMQP